MKYIKVICHSSVEGCDARASLSSMRRPPEHLRHADVYKRPNDKNVTPCPKYMYYLQKSD
jgi:hypothetical protein